MAQLVGLIVSEDDAFKKHFGRLLRAGAIPVSVIEERSGRDGVLPDMVIVDTRGDASSSMSSIERLRASAPGAGIFAVALVAEPELILQSMRAGANEFFTWPPVEETFHGAIRRTAARRETAHGAKPSATTLVFFGAKGGAGTTTVAVNCGVEVARLTKRSTVVVDLKPGLGEVALFLGLRPRYSLLDAIDNLHRLDREFLKELVVKHKSGLEILAGSDQFDRPGAALRAEEDERGRRGASALRRFAPGGGPPDGAVKCFFRRRPREELVRTGAHRLQNQIRLGLQRDDEDPGIRRGGAEPLDGCHGRRGIAADVDDDEIDRRVFARVPIVDDADGNRTGPQEPPDLRRERVVVTDNEAGELCHVIGPAGSRRGTHPRAQARRSG